MCMDVRWSRVILAGLGACLVLFVVGPLLRLLLESSPRHLAEAIQDPELRASIGLTVVTATAATLLGALLGIPLAYLLARRSFPGRRIIQGIIDLPVVIPHPVAGIALLLFLGRRSTVGGILSHIGLEFVSHVPGIVAAMQTHVVIGIAVAVLAAVELWLVMRHRPTRTT